MTNQTIKKDCPDQGVLVDFLQGKLVPPELEDCEAHLEDCEICQETLSGINASDTLSEVVAKAMVSSQPANDDAEVVQSLVRRFGNSADFTITRSDISGKELLRDRAAEVLLHVSPDPEDEQSLGLLAGFRLRELLGSGGTGVVFRAYDLALDREIALKVLRPSLGDLARDRFVAEARAAASIDHENVVAIYQVGEQDRMAWIAMKWVPGETLESRLTWETSLAEKEVRQIAIQIANGLAEAHRQQLVHRDIKPANVWIGDADGKVLILDFGLVRITDNDPALTATGMLAGTPNFMSPEQAKGQELDARSDLFSLGCVMYQMITGTLPFGSPTILATLQSIQTQQPEPPILFADDCSEELSDLTMALLEKKPANRVDSAESLVRCLDTPRSDWPANIKRCVASRRESDGNGLKAAATASQGSRFGAGSLISAVLLGLFGFGLWLFAPQIIRVATNQGELVIETDDENVEVTVTEDGESVRVLDTSSGSSFDIRSGEFQISAVGKDGKTEFIVIPNQLSMKRGGREVVKVIQTKNKASLTKISEPEVAGSGKLLYRGRRLSEWLNVLEVDRDPKTQSEAIQACAILYLSIGQEDEFVALLQNYMQRNMNLYRGQEKTTCFSGFEDSIKKLSAKKIAELFKLQLMEGTPTSISWIYRGMTYPQDPSAVPFSKSLRKVLSSDSEELLRLIADRKTGNDVEYLIFVLQRLSRDPVSNTSVKLIKKITAKMSAKDVIETAEFVPKAVLTPEFFAPAISQLFAADNPNYERLRLVENLMRVEKTTHGKTTFLSKMLRSKAGELLRLTANGDTKLYTNLLFEYIYKNLLEEPYSDDEIDAVREVLVKLKPKDLFDAAERVPTGVLSKGVFASVKNQLFASDAKAEDRDYLIGRLITIEASKKGKASFILEILAEVVNNQLFAAEKLNFNAWREMTVEAAVNTTEDGPKYRAEKRFVISNGFERIDIKGHAVVARLLLSKICERLMDNDITDKGKLAKEMVAILSKSSSEKKAADSAIVPLYKDLKIDYDIQELKKLSQDQYVTFSKFVSSPRTFGKRVPDRPVERLPVERSNSSSDRIQKDAQIVFEGKQLTEWLHQLETDRAASSQAEALKACAALYASSGRYKESMAVLQEYLKRNTTNEQLYQGQDRVACFSGFADSLKTLPPKKIVDLFRLQLKEGNKATISWTYRGMTKTQALGQSRTDTVPFSTALQKELKVNSVDLLRLIADRDNCDSVAYILNLIVKHSIKDPASDEEINAINAVMTKLSPEKFWRSAVLVPSGVLTLKLFADVKGQLFAADTSAIERDNLLMEFHYLEEKADGRAKLILGILAEVVANQLYARDSVKFDQYQSMKVHIFVPDDLREGEKKNYYPLRLKSRRITSRSGSWKTQGIHGRAVAARRVLSIICERLLKSKSSDELTRIVAILSKASLKQPAIDPTKLEHFNELRIFQDVEALKKLSQRQSGEFSNFVNFEPRKFEAKPKVSPEK